MIQFQLYQVENNFQKYQRIKRFYQLIQNKALKKDEFKNSSLWLEAVVGGDVTSPTCNGNNGTTAGEAVATLFYSLAAASGGFYHSIKIMIKSFFCSATKPSLPAAMTTKSL